MLTAGKAQRIDINNTSNWAEERLTEAGYTAWTVGTTKEAQITVDGVTIKAMVEGQQADRTLKGEWWKDGVQKYSKLTSDGLGVFGLDANNNTPQITEGEVGITLIISGLSAGLHTLLAYHNNPTGYQGPQVQAYVNGEWKANSFQTNRAQKASESGRTHFSFVAEEGKDVVVTYRTNPEMSDKETTTTSLFINALEFDVNPFLASDPVPANNDMHADCDNDEVRLSWKGYDGDIINYAILLSEDSAMVDRGNERMFTLGNITTTDTTVVVKQAFSPLKRYFWRVDILLPNGDILLGDLWSFRPRRLAFPDAEGYGRWATGGRGGSVYHVTSLDDDVNDPQPGTFRYGITRVSGPRTVVFDVAGTIELKGRLTCSDKYVTIAGQTAPGRGVMLKGAPFGMQSEGITRFLRMRLGYHNGNTDKGLDGLGMAGNDHSIMDHCSISWTIDEGFSSRNAKNVTLQRTLISEALNIADHPNYESGKAHGFAATIGGGENGGLGSSYHHNLLAHNEGRNWSISGGLDGQGAYDGHHDIFNNVVYNWGGRATDGGTHEGQFVANYYKVGPATTQMFLLNAQIEGTGTGSQAYYVSGNIRENLDGTKTQDALNTTYKYTLSGGQKLDWTVFQDKPFFPSQAKVETADEAYQSVLSDVGCNMPALDNHDERMINETLHGTTSTVGCKSGKKGLIDRETDAEGFDGLNIYYAQRPEGWDTDQDGMPDWWERCMGSDPLVADNNEALDNYTLLEHYLEWLAAPHFIVAADRATRIDLKPYFAGFGDFGVEIENVLRTDRLSSDTEGIHVTAEGTTLQVQGANVSLVKVYVRAIDAVTGYQMTRSVNIAVSSEAAAVAVPRRSIEQSASLYDLGGRRQSQPRRGLNITKGRKFVQ